MNELTLVADRLAAARSPEEVFGAGDAVSVKAAFRHLLRVVHPDFNGDAVVAKVATERLNVLRTLAEVRLANGTWGKRLPLPEHTPIAIGEYLVHPKPIHGDLADVYRGTDKSVLVKVARTADDNDLLRAERVALRMLDGGVVGLVRDGVPRLVDEFQVASGAGLKREVNVLERMDGFHTMEQVADKIGFVDARTIVWMFKRLLVLLEWTHKCGLVHGAVLPSHVMAYPDNAEALGIAVDVVGGKRVDHLRHPYKHTLRLVDWCYSVEYAGRTRLSAWVPAWESHYPPELREKREVLPSSDVYMAACLMDCLMGNFTEMEEPLTDVLMRCMEDDPAKRFANTGDVFDAWMQAAEIVYGPPRWHDFNL